MAKKKIEALKKQKELIGGGLLEIETANNEEGIVCQHCSEPISNKEDYILFAELHYLNLRDQAKLNLISEL